MSHCVLYHVRATSGVGYNIKGVFGPFDFAKCKAVLAAVKITREREWRNHDIKDMQAQLMNQGEMLSLHLENHTSEAYYTIRPLKVNPLD